MCSGATMICDVARRTQRTRRAVASSTTNSPNPRGGSTPQACGRLRNVKNCMIFPLASPLARLAGTGEKERYA